MPKMFEAGLTQTFQKEEKKVFGVTTAMVVDNIDCTGEARVMLQLPFLPGFFPWARVATPMAGLARGTFFIPQIGDEVLVAFNHGDVREPFIIGSLWNTTDRPPALSPTDAVTKRAIRTPFGQEVSFDEVQQSVTIKNTTFNSLTLDTTGASLSVPIVASITLDVTGNVTIKAVKQLKLVASIIDLEAVKVNIHGSASATINGGAHCTVTGEMVDIGLPVP